MSIFLPFARNIINFVFEMFTAILLLRNQLEIFWSSTFTKFMSSGKLLCSARHEVSSANKKVARFVTVKRSLI